MKRIPKSSVPPLASRSTGGVTLWLARLCITLALAGIASTLVAQETADPSQWDQTERLIEQILEMREQLEALLATLPPELRQEVEARWLERQAERQASAQIESPTTPAEIAPLAQPEVPMPTEPIEAIADAEETDDLLFEPVEAQVDGETSVAPAQTEDPASTATCIHMAAFDTNEDGRVTGGDKYWRYLRLWKDNGDDTVNEELEIQTLYELGIKGFSLNLDYYDLPDDVSGDIRVGESVELMLFGPKIRSGSAATLVVQAGRMSRGSEIWLEDPSGQVLTGYQPIGPTIVAESAEGRRDPLVCP